MIKNKLIIMLIFSIQMSHLNAMTDLKEAIERLGDHTSVDCKDDQDGGQSGLTTISLGNPENKRKNDEPMDPITGKTQEMIIERERVAKFYVFFQTFKNQADVIWKDREKTEASIIKKYVSNVKQADFDRNTRIHASIAQKKIDEYYVEQYTVLYTQLYLAHYKTTTPEKVAQYYASQRYSHQKSEDCCVIL